MGDRGWAGVDVDVIAHRIRGGVGRIQRARIRRVLVRSLRELFPQVEGTRVRVRPTFGGAWEIAFSCVCPAHQADVPADRGARADTLVESLASVALVGLFGRVAVEHATARPTPDISGWRIRLVLCV